MIFAISSSRKYCGELLPTGGKNTRDQAAKLVHGESVQPQRSEFKE
jgi:hypothetical protein